MYLANLQRNRETPLRITGKRSHNNRKMTLGRKERRHSLGSRRGYIPNELIHATKMLALYESKLKQLQRLEGSELLDSGSKILHIENLIRKYKDKIDNYDSK